jgi:hypothetical protein
MNKVPEAVATKFTELFMVFLSATEDLKIAHTNLFSQNMYINVCSVFEQYKLITMEYLK